ncbi:Predicted DNA-binding transcriptional regulator YafY, contains an HTH and WYL domains [Caminicella sporogenes DSM 14501]|uniref:Predicted DNA-binding transcriptional regulator YafY, contains an HTH and WYL domains n=1 Tax=Caminicella sporogenes DSM 14501 TaxID=1121266 RepID=A0A1M6RDD5_9FIRM|nr:WYL domain-containing protein [Caminicella sporogenes]RKD25201.1 hypothetical protein BET04_02995 [Caminicella sporogenes]SHK30479.1 Predicted DNA-binding transcriptional regulator YafY, contains an HTH and WYL domains [Caminicella sporogenes DSM 14501]
MAKGAYKNFIKSYDTIRNVLRHLYIYGCYGREDFESIGISGRKYDNERRRILYFIDQELVNENFISNKKYIGFKYDMFKTAENFLVNSYLIKTFTVNDINYFFLIQQILNVENRELSMKEIMDNLSEILSVDIDMSTIRRKINKMIEQGIIVTRNVKNRKVFNLVEDFFKDFTNDEIVKIFYAVQFYSNLALISVPGYYLMDTIKNYLKHERNYDFNEKEIYIFKHHLLNRIIDDEVVTCILNCIKNGRKMKFYYRNEKNPRVVIPLKIITEYCYGRQYLFSLDEMSNKCSLYRLDKINKFSEAGDIGTKVNFEKYNKFIENSWCAVLLNENQGLIEVEIDFFIDESEEGYILQRILKEGKWGTLDKIEKGKYLYKIKVTDPNELIPWIRSFAGFAKVRKSDNHNLYEKIENDWKEALKNYGAI